MSKKSANKRMQLDVVQGNFNEKNEFVAEKGVEIKKGIVKQLTPEEIQQIERQKKITLRSSYMMDFTKKKIDKSHGFGKINAFVDGDRLNPKLIQTGNDPNSLYIKKNQAILSKSKTGVTTYQWDFCGLKLKNKGRSRSML